MEHDDVSFLSSLYGGYWNYEIHDFCYMTNHYFPPEGLLEDMRGRLVELVKAYPSTNWYLSSLLAEPLGLSHRDLVVGNGGSELISAITQRFVENLAVPVPSFDEFINRARIQGKVVSPFPMTARFKLDIDGFIQHVRSTGANSALLIRPNNPSGDYVSKAEVTHFLNSMRTLDLILVDESFIEFVDAEDSPSVLDLMFEYPNLMILKSLSKNYGIPGLRLGYAASGNANRIASLREDLPIWNINSLAQFFLEEVGAYHEEFMDSCRRVRAATRRLYKGLEEVPYLYPYPTQGNFVLCWILYGFTAQELTDALFERSRTLVNSCSAKNGLDDRFVRIACRTEEENDWLVEILKELALVPPKQEPAVTSVRYL